MKVQPSSSLLELWIVTVGKRQHCCSSYCESCSNLSHKGVHCHRQGASFSNLENIPVSLYWIIEKDHIIINSYLHRKPFEHIPKFKIHFPRVPLMALTATATPDTRKQVEMLRDPICTSASVNKANTMFLAVQKLNLGMQMLTFPPIHI